MIDKTTTDLTDLRAILTHARRHTKSPYLATLLDAALDRVAELEREPTPIRNRPRPRLRLVGGRQ